MIVMGISPMYLLVYRCSVVIERENELRLVMMEILIITMDVVVVVQYIVTWIVFITSVYFNHNMWNSQMCHVVTVSFSLVNHVALGVALFVTSVWYAVVGCCSLPYISDVC